MSTPAIVSGLYRYVRNGISREPTKTLAEIKRSLDLNPFYREELMFLAGDKRSAEDLQAEGLKVSRIFTDAPEHVRQDAAHKMKHWMCLWTLKNHGEVLWVDWDTVCLKMPGKRFWEWCRKCNTPKFVSVPNYWATVNCSVYYVSKDWIEPMERSLQAEVSEPNDELLWMSVLPQDVRQRPEYWWGDRAVHVWSLDEISNITTDTYFAHVRDLDYANELRRFYSNMNHMKGGVDLDD